MSTDNYPDISTFNTLSSISQNDYVLILQDGETQVIKVSDIVWPAESIQFMLTSTDVINRAQKQVQYIKSTSQKINRETANNTLTLQLPVLNVRLKGFITASKLSTLEPFNSPRFSFTDTYAILGFDTEYVNSKILSLSSTIESDEIQDIINGYELPFTNPNNVLTKMGYQTPYICLKAGYYKVRGAAAFNQQVSVELYILQPNSPLKLLLVSSLSKDPIMDGYITICQDSIVMFVVRAPKNGVATHIKQTGSNTMSGVNRLNPEKSLDRVSNFPVQYDFTYLGNADDLLRIEVPWNLNNWDMSFYPYNDQP